MPVYLITLHTYRSWNTDRPHVQRGQTGVQPVYSNLAKYRNQIANHAPVQFGPSQRRIVSQAVIEVCQNTDRQLHALTVVPNHVHVLCSWKNEELPEKAATHFKRIIGMKLSRDKGSTGNRWFSRGQDIERISDRKHFDYLVEIYLPKHLEQNGIFWKPAPD